MSRAARGIRLGPERRCGRVTRNMRPVRARLIAGAVLAGVILVSGVADASLPPPGFGRSVDIGLVSGTVIVTPRGGHSFVLGTNDRNVALGSLIDTTHGRVDLRAAPPPSRAGDRATAARVEDAQFYDGAFRVTQSASSPVAQIRLAVGNTAPCTAHAADRDALVPRRRPPHKVVRLLWASGSGTFRTVGRYSAATVLGTRWLTEDFCDGTLVRVARGVVVVEDLATHATVTVRAGHSVFTPAAAAARR
jgi:hypothetical protein